MCEKVTFELWVVNHWRLPLAVHIIIPVVGLGGIGIGDVLGLVPVLGFRGVWVGDFLTLIPLYSTCFKSETLIRI